MKKATVANLLTGQGLARRETPYGSGAIPVSQKSFEVAWIYKDKEDIDPNLLRMDVDDVLVVLQGGLKLELRGQPERDVILGPGDMFVIPAEVPFRGYRYPRDQAEPTIFIALYAREESERGH